MQIDLSNRDVERGLKLPEYLTSDLAYLCGVFAGDGSINHRPHKYEYELKVVGNPRDEKQFYHKILVPRFESVFGFKPKISIMDGGVTYGFRIYSKALCVFLNKIGLPIGIKYDSLQIPKCFENNLIVKFIKGVFDTDGCICFKKNHGKSSYPVISLTSKSDNFIREISSILKILEIPISTTYNYKVRDERLKKGFTFTNRIYINGEKNVSKFLEKIGFSSPKHISKIKKYSRAEHLTLE